ncbi:MAG: phosphoribosylglycinamide formyltransferase [Salinibacter sp.]
MRLSVFASGGGTNFQAILDAIAEGALSAEVAVCISNTPEAGALSRARKQNIPTAVHPPSTFDGPIAFGNALLDTLRHYNVEFVALAGYMLKVPPNVVATYRNRMTNIHPALLPAFGGQGMYGRHVHEAVLEYGARWSGATVHLVTEEYDQGPIVLQEPVPVFADDTPDRLAERVRSLEHTLYPEALRLFAEDRVHIDGRHVQLDDYDPHSPSS